MLNLVMTTSNLKRNCKEREDLFKKVIQQIKIVTFQIKIINSLKM